MTTWYKSAGWLPLMPLCVLLGCAAQPSPRERYVAALNAKFRGDAQGYQAGLIALAHDAPESRAGRRALATLTGGGGVASIGMLGALAAVAVPNFMKYQGRARQAEAKTLLRQAAVWLESARAENEKFPTSFEPDSLGTASRAYALFYAPDAAIMPEEPQFFLQEAADVLRLMGVQPHVAHDTYLLVAVGQLDKDGDLDIWSLDHRGNLLHLTNDLQ